MNKDSLPTEEQKGPEVTKKQTKIKRTVEVGDLMDEKTGLPHLLVMLDDFQKKPKDDPIQNVDTLMELYQQWSKGVKEGFTFEAFLSQLYKLGKNETVCDWIRNQENKTREEEEYFMIEQREEVATDNLDNVEDDDIDVLLDDNY